MKRRVSYGVRVEHKQTTVGGTGVGALYGDSGVASSRRSETPRDATRCHDVNGGDVNGEKIDGRYLDYERDPEVRRRRRLRVDVTRRMR